MPLPVREAGVVRETDTVALLVREVCPVRELTNERDADFDENGVCVLSAVELCVCDLAAVPVFEKSSAERDAVAQVVPAKPPFEKLALAEASAAGDFTNETEAEYVPSTNLF